MKSKRLIFGDESGDAGMNIEKGSSRYFVIVFVIFEDFLEAEKVSLEIKKLRRLRFKNDIQEFHFAKDSMATRKAFFDSITNLDFKIKAYVVDKSHIDRDVYRENEKFYEYFLSESFKEFAQYFDGAKVHFDGKTSIDYKKKMTTSINRVIKNKGYALVNLKFMDSRSDNLIQLADMVAGLISKSLQIDNKDLSIMHGSIKSKLEIVKAIKQNT